MVMTAPATAMGDASLRDRLPVLWRRIEDAHYTYLETDDSPEKLQLKKKLEGYIMEYLSLVPHDCKFGLAETAKVFQRTLNELPEFSACRAGLGWAALARYADNLLSQPWRKEYKVIRMYSGYYKHEVEANLVGAECLLHALGYRAAGAGRLALDAPVCPDVAAAVSRDALIAQCECQIMAHIWESVWSSGTRVTWAEVARARASRTAGLPTPTGHNHAYVHGSEIYSNLPTTVSSDQHVFARRAGPCGFAAGAPDPLPEDLIQPVIHPHYVVPANTVPTPMMYQAPQQHVHNEVPIAHPQCNPVPMVSPYPVPYYYPVHTPYMIPTPVFAPIKQANNIPINGYPAVPQCRGNGYPSVPTAQLIELDTPSSYENRRDKHRDDDGGKRGRLGESSRRNSTSRSGFSDATLPSLPRSDTQPTLSKAKEDGMGTYESWDYVFRNLSSKERDGDARSRFSPSLDRDSRTLDRLDREERRVKYQPTTLDLEDGLQALHLDRSYDEENYRTAKVNENLMRLKQEQELKRAKQMAKKQVQDERKTKRLLEPVGNPRSDALVPHRVAPDKVKLLSRKDVKDRKEVMKQQNGSTAPSLSEARKLKKPVKQAAGEPDRRGRGRPAENGVPGVVPGGAHDAKHSAATSSAAPANYELKAQLVVSLDEADSPPGPALPPPSPAHNGERERETQDAGDGAPKRDKWECGTCTYLNRPALIVCEMCGKSKRGPEIQPLTSGGRECPACTLVNQRDARACDACGTSLEHCPTYI